VIDFIDMVLESNRDLVMRRLLECLGRDRTKHQVAEVTSLGLVQMTRKRVGQGLLEAFSETCDKCNGRGVLVHMEPVSFAAAAADQRHDDDRSDRSEKHDRGQKGKQAANAANAAKGDGQGGGGTATLTEDEAENGAAHDVHSHDAHDDHDDHDDSHESGRGGRRKRRKSHGHQDRRSFDPQYDVEGVSEEFRDYSDAEPATAGPVTVTRISEERDDDHARVTVETETVPAAEAEAAATAARKARASTASKPAPEVAGEDATFPGGTEESVVAATAESEAAVEAALGGSGTLAGDTAGTAAPKKRGLRVRRAAKRPAGPPSVND
jgi:ribonuclease E